MILLAVLVLYCALPAVAFVPITRVGRVLPAQRTTTSALHFLDDDSQENPSATSSAVIAPFWKLLDLNQDGKVDVQDLVWLANNVLDVNGDGKIDGKDGQAALSMVLLSWMLMISPVQAKGGGHGGGGGGGGGHSSSHYSGGSSRPHYEPFKRHLVSRQLNQQNNEWDPSACSDLPVSGEVVDVLVNSQRGTYVPGVVTSVNEKRCSFEANIVGGGDGKVYPASKHLTTNRNWVDWASVLSLPLFWGSLGVADLLSPSVQDWDDYFDKEFDVLQNANANGGLKLPPPFRGVGKYEGSTQESDGANQDVQTTLTFHDDGSISGYGIDSDDGPYTVTGAWAKNKVKWTEQYEGFSTTVRGEILPDKSIQCRFVSSRYVRGRFTIRKKNPLSKMFGVVSSK